MKSCDGGSAACPRRWHAGEAEGALPRGPLLGQGEQDEEPQEGDEDQDNGFSLQHVPVKRKGGARKR